MKSSERAARKVVLDFRLKPNKDKSLDAALSLVESYCNTKEIGTVLAEWPTIPEEVRRVALAKAPVFARVLALAQRIPNANQ